jgi:hypothetical protein
MTMNLQAFRVDVCEKVDNFLKVSLNEGICVSGLACQMTISAFSGTNPTDESITSGLPVNHPRRCGRRPHCAIHLSRSYIALSPS